MNRSARTPELVVPLDVPGLDPALACVESLGPAIDFYKVGLELFTAAGPEAVRRLRADGKRVFLDLKLHDIPATVSRAVRAAAALDVSLLTLHGAGGRAMIRAAREAADGFGSRRPRLLAVTVLTSLNADDLSATGVRHDPATQAQALADLAIEAGADGLVCSVHEAARLRRRFGADVLIVTPGIRPCLADRDDQKRVATPQEAVRSGATHLVVGRPITAAPNPRAAAAEILSAIRQAAGPP